MTESPAGPKRGTLRLYLGAAPGVGKTFAMLNEGRRRSERGADVVVGYVETHGRPRTAEQVGELEVIPRRRLEHRGAAMEEMDLDAVIRRHPDLVLVDELAHTNVPGSRHAKRWQDVDDLLAAGIDVISTVNVQHLESLNDVVERITGIHQRETVPDAVARSAAQIELVDMAPEALRRRLAHGNVYAADKIDAALGNYFRPGNLSALRELALLWVADRVDDALLDYRQRHGITRPWETRERVVVALAGAPGSDDLIRRAARIAQRAHGELIGVHVVADTGLIAGESQSTDHIAAQRRLLEELGGEYRRVTSNDVADALVELARAENATQIVLGASGRSRWQELFGGSVINRVVRRSGPIDVHVISKHVDDDEDPSARRLPQVGAMLTPLPRRRQLWGWVIATAGLPLITLAGSNLRAQVGLTSVLLLYLLLAMVVALIGGVLPATAAVVGGFLLANFYFTPPQYELTISRAEDVIALVVYAVAAGIVAVLVDRIGRSRLRAARLHAEAEACSRLRAARLHAEAEALASLAGSLAAPGATGAMLGDLRSTFGMRAAALLRRSAEGWTVVASSGAEPPATPDDADERRDVGDGIQLVLAGGALSAADQRVLDAFAAHVGAAAEHERLEREAGRAGDLAAANTLRTALLQAVSHDLRTPLASIKAAISSLRQRDLEWPPAAVDEFEATIEEEIDRLTGIVGDLLDMSRLQASALTVDLRPVGVEEVALAAVSAAPGGAVHVDVPDELPDVLADPALLERALANLVANALRHSPPDAPVKVVAGEVLVDGQRHVDVRVVDRGPGIPPSERELVFQPFQRLVDHRADGGGVGLGLAIARGFVEAMDGHLTIEDTPGGGVTMVVELTPAEGPSR